MRLVIILICVVFSSGVQAGGSPYAVFMDAVADCPDHEFRESVTRWVELTGNFIQATVSMRKCSQFPESIIGEKRSYKESVFRLEHPPDIGAYISTMQESETKRRMNRAWNLYQFIKRDRDTYFYEEREDLSVIPATLEKIALGQADDPGRSLCEVETTEVNVLDRSVLESNDWNQLIAMRKTYTKPEEQKSLKEIERLLRFLYSDPSIARNAWLNFAGFPWVATKSYSPKVIENYLEFLKSLEQGARSAPRRPMTLPPPQFDSSRIKELSDVERRCTQYYLPHFLESQKDLLPPGQVLRRTP